VQEELNSLLRRQAHVADRAALADPTAAPGAAFEGGG
jgi:hypothetical protein